MTKFGSSSLLLCSIQAYALGHAVKIWNDMKIFNSLVLAAILSVALFFTTRSFSAVPNHQMSVASGNINGIASVYTEKFIVSLEGHSFGDRKKSGFYVVDGRNGGLRIPWLDDTLAIKQSDGVEYAYSGARRLFTLKFKNHKIEYSHPLNTLKVDGKEFSTLNAPIHVLVKKNRQINELKSQEMAR